jgi:excisionase family DNA binding protein
MKANENLQDKRYAFSVKEVADFIGVSSRTVWTLVNEGQLPKFRVGTRVLIPKEGLERFIQERTAVEPQNV